MNNKIYRDEALNPDSNVHMKKKNHPAKELKKTKQNKLTKQKRVLGRLYKK